MRGEVRHPPLLILQLQSQTPDPPKANHTAKRETRGSPHLTDHVQSCRVVLPRREAGGAGRGAAGVGAADCAGEIRLWNVPRKQTELHIPHAHKGMATGLLSGGCPPSILCARGWVDGLLRVRGGVRPLDLLPLGGGCAVGLPGLAACQLAKFSKEVIWPILGFGLGEWVGPPRGRGKGCGYSKKRGWVAPPQGH